MSRSSLLLHLLRKFNRANHVLSLLSSGLQIRSVCQRQILQVGQGAEAPGDGLRDDLSRQALRSASTQMVHFDDRDALRSTPVARTTSRIRLELLRSRDTSPGQRYSD